MNESVPVSGDVLIRLRLDCAYDGTDFIGWAIQATGRTVQGVIQDALATIVGQPVSLTVAGRTDSGVHAAAQVAHFDIPQEIWQRYGDRMAMRLQSLLPEDISVKSLAPAPAGFDARFSALTRHYIYRISPVADPLHRRDRIVRPTLDVEQMKQAGQLLLGEHDFLAFCKPREGATTIRTLLKCNVIESDGVVELHVSADAFCHSMVRAIAGALVAVGEGRRDLAWISSLLDVSTKPSDVPVLPPQGLTLVAVDYPAADQLASRALLTRARRTHGEPDADTNDGGDQE